MSTPSTIDYITKRTMARMIYTPRAVKRIIANLANDGFISRVNGKPVREFLGTTIQLRDCIDRIPAIRHRYFNIALSLAVSSAYLIKTPPGWVSQFLADPKNNHVEEDSILKNLEEFKDFGDYNILDAINSSMLCLEESPSKPVGFDQVQSIFGEFDTYYKVVGKNLLTFANIPVSDVNRHMMYHMFLASIIHEYMARQMNLNPIDIVGYTPQLYIYDDERDSDVRLYPQPPRWPLKMNAMPKITPSDLESYQWLVTKHLTDNVFMNTIQRPDFLKSDGLAYLSQWALVLRCFVMRHSHPVEVKQAHDVLSDKTLKYVLRPWLAKSGAVSIPSFATYDMEEI